jgi:periplasmic copper chaperone A
MIVTNTRQASLGALLAALAYVGVAAAAEPSIDIVDAWARATPVGVENGAVYCRIVNHGGADKLVGVRSAAAHGAEIHTSTSENGVVAMRRIEALPIGPGASVELAPGGTHVMLVGLAAPLAAGAKLEVTLVFATAGEMAVEVPVVDARAPPAGHEHEHHAQ